MILDDSHNYGLRINGIYIEMMAPTMDQMKVPRRLLNTISKGSNPTLIQHACAHMQHCISFQWLMAGFASRAWPSEHSLNVAVNGCQAANSGFGMKEQCCLYFGMVGTFLSQQTLLAACLSWSSYWRSIGASIGVGPALHNILFIMCPCSTAWVLTFPL